MSKLPDGVPPPPALSPELQAALQGAVDQSIGSLDSLRITLRDYVHVQQKRGKSLGEIDGQLRKLISEVHAKSDGDGVATGLTTQIVKWTRSFFSGMPD